MKDSEFEEKEYEGPLYNQLERNTNLLWQPGQVFEKHIGVDRCIYIDDVNIWRQIGLHIVPPGVSLPRYNWGYIWSHRIKRKKLPSFKLNLFIQAKRSQFGTTPSKMKSYMFGKTCYKFGIVNHQQQALEQLDTNLKGRAMICYAAPMFAKDSELQRHTVNATIIDNSTFPDVNKLTGHSSWYYNRKVNGVANVDPTPISVDDLLKRINNFYNDNKVNSESNEDNLVHNIVTLRDSIYKSFDKIEDNPRLTYLFDRRIILENYLEKNLELESLYHPSDYEYIIENLDLFKSYFEIALFTIIFNLNWFIIDDIT